MELKEAQTRGKTYSELNYYNVPGVLTPTTSISKLQHHFRSHKLRQGHGIKVQKKKNE
jgi:hypothetical protein